MLDFDDRADAGRRLAERLGGLRGRDAVVLGLPRGGVPVAFEVARALRAPLDVIVVRKLGVPFQPELAMGAIGEGGVLVVNDEIVRRTGLDETDLTDAQRREQSELDVRVERFRRGRPRVELGGRTAVVDARVDAREHCFPMIPAGAAALDLVEYEEPERVGAA